MLTLTGYRVNELVFDGPRSLVYRATHEETGRPVMIKIHRDEFPSAIELASMRRAYDLSTRLAIPSVVRHLALERYRNRLALVTEDFGAVALSRMLASRRMPLGEFLDVASGIAGALGELHEHGVTHNDLKPQNIVLSRSSGEVKIIDLGIATELPSEGGAPVARGFHGSLHYASPEQTGRINRPVDHRSDLYSFGVCCYEMLLGSVPFDSDDPMELLHCHIARRPEPPHEVDPSVPEVVSRIVLKLLAKSADARYQSASGVKRDLEECLAQLREKGFVEPFPLGLRDVSSRYHVPQRLFGRERELARLVDAFEETAGGSTRVVMVTGYSGIGKTSLVHELRHAVAARRGYFCAGKFELYRRDRPYLALVEALRGLVRLALAEGGARLERLRASLGEALGDNARVMIDLVPEVEMLVGGEVSQASIGPVEAQRRFRRVLLAFVRAFATEDHPLVLFLDDLQWADLASLDALRTLATEPETSHLLLVGGYRENEIAASSPLHDLLRDLREQGRGATTIRLAPLDPPTVAQLVAATVRTTPEAARPLAAIVSEKTHGNPFFIRQFLRALHQEQLVRFDARSGAWSWDLDAIRGVGSTENVVKLLTQRVARLPEATRAALEVAACIGAEFDLRTLAVVRGSSPMEAASALSPALEQGLVVCREASHGHVTALAFIAAESGDDRGVRARYRFLHDRVQQAAHELLPNEARSARHLQIGRLLLADAGDRLDADAAVDVANHMNVGRALIMDAAERLRLSELNLRAGRRAKASLALEAAAHHLAIGIELLPPDPFRSHHALALALHVEAAETAFARGDTVVVARHSEVVLARARSTLERIPIFRIRMLSGIASSRYGEAVDVALLVLAELGVHLPRKPGPHHVASALVATRLAMGGRHPSDLADLPPLADERVRAAMEILVTAASCAYFAEPKLLPLVGLALVRLSLEHGNCALSAYGYALYGLVLCGALHRIDEGYAYGELARAVLERFPARELVKVQFVVDSFVRHYKEPLADIAPSLLDSWRRSLDVGDVETAVYCCGASLYDSIFAGTNVDAILERHRAAIRQMQESNQEHSKPGFAAWVALLELLQDVTRRDGRLDSETFAIDAWAPKLAASRNYTALALASVASGIYAFVHGELREARARFRAASRSIEALASQSVVPQLHFYRAATELRLASRVEVPAPERARILVAARLDRARLAAWERHAPDTFAPKVALLEALELSVRGHVGRSIERFQQAIDGAQSAGLVHEAALAAELLAEHCAKAGLGELAVHYVRRAHLLFSRWGAQGKVRALELAHWDVFRAPPPYLGELPPVGETTGSLDEQLDVASVVKAVSTLTKEMDLERLLSRVMRVVIENAGAERAVLLTMRDGELRVEAEGGLEGTMVHVDGPTADHESSGVSPAIAAYAARIRQSVVLADASTDPLFSRDPWVARRKARSILCAPLLRSGALTGLVFLENSLVAGAFTQNRVRVLEIICGQAAVSIESARLYKSLEQTLEAQVRLTTAHSRFVPHPFLQALDRQNIVDVELGDHASKEMSVLFSDIRGFARHMERLTPSQGIEFLNTYLSRMEAPIVAHGGFVDSYVGDAIMALFEKSADQAVRAGLGMLAALATLNRERERVGEPPIHHGVGINTGTLVLGTIGGRSHLKCGVIGDSVNVASRVESLTKQYGVSMLVSGPTFDRLEDPGRYLHRRIERVRVVGRETPVTIYEVYDADAPAERDAKAATAQTFAEGLALHYERDFAGAVARFEECARRAPRDRVAAIHLERARRLASEGVDAAWDGVIRLEKK